MDTIEKWEKREKRIKKNHPVWYKLRYLYYNSKRMLEEIRLFPRRIKWFIQRGKRGWADCDTWGLDFYLADIIENSIQYLKKNKYGYPNDLTEGKWIDILNEISYAFYLSKKIIEMDLLLIRNPKKRKENNKHWEIFNKQNKTNIRCMTDKEIKAYDKGWKLFKEYFFNLWD